MQFNRLNNNKIDSYSALICSNYFETKEDYINLICVNSKFKETTEKFRYYPISIKSLKLFPKIQTQYLYKNSDKMIKRKQIIKYELWYLITYAEYTQHRNRNNVKCHSVEYTNKNRKEYREKIPDCVTSLSDLCFIYCDLTTINLPSLLKSLGDRCFSYCSTLSRINLPSSLTSLGAYCFRKCKTLSSINLPNSLTSFGKGCFYRCSELKGVINVPDYCFDEPS